MTLDKTHQYVFRIGSDNQHRLLWDGAHWQYEFLAGGVLFDRQRFGSETELIDAIAVHGLTLDQFHVDESGDAEGYSREIQEKIARLTALGIVPCTKHGLMSKNEDNSCEVCNNPDLYDDFKGTEG